MKMELVISMDERGNVSVSGPIENMVVCFGLLEVAKDAVRNFSAQSQKRIVPATETDLSRMRDKIAT